MKVLHITNAYPYDEIPEYGVFIKEQVDSLNVEGVDNEIYFINGRKYGIKAYLKAIKELRSVSSNFDIIHCHHLYSSLVLLLAFGWKKPVVLSFLNDWLHEVKGRRLKPFRWIFCRTGIFFADYVIFKSPIPAELRSKPNIINIPNGVDDDFFKVLDKENSKKQLGLEVNKRYILFVSSKNQFRSQKRYDLFSKVIKVLQGRRPDLNIEELVMVNQVREKIPLFFNAAAVHLLTSDYEGSPNSVKEALCCGLPVVSRDAGNVLEMMTGLPFSCVIDVDDPVILADKVESLLVGYVDRDVLRASFLDRGITKNNIAKKIINLYRSIID